MNANPTMVLPVSPGTLEMHSTWALQTLNWSTSEPGWLASMMTTLLAEWVLVRIHTRLLMPSDSWSSFDWDRKRGDDAVRSECSSSMSPRSRDRFFTFLFSGEVWLLFLSAPFSSAWSGSLLPDGALAAADSWLLTLHPVRSTPAAHHSYKHDQRRFTARKVFTCKEFVLVRSCTK